MTDHDPPTGIAPEGSSMKLLHQAAIPTAPPVTDASTTPSGAGGAGGLPNEGIEQPPPPPTGPRARLLAIRPRLHHAALIGVLALSAVLNIHKLRQNGYANVFYSAGVKSMLQSLHNFLFVSSDPGGLITVDKPPLAVWLQAASAKVFGFHPLSLLLPEAIAGVLAVALLYRVLSRRFGPAAGISGALAMAVFPSLVAVSRENGVDPLLILLLVMACAAGIRAAETGRWRSLLSCAVLVGLAFNTKTLAAYLAVPGIALAFLLCAPGSLVGRILKLTVAGLLMVAVSFSWIAFVESTPASKRPYVGSSTNNTELGLTFSYNGFGRVGGQEGGPGRIPVRQGATFPFTSRQLEIIRRHQAKHKATAASEFAGASGSALAQYRKPTPFPGGASPVRLFGKALGGQAAWLFPLALFGLFALVLLAYDRWRGVGGVGGSVKQRRRDPQLAALVVLGCWFLVEALVLSFSKGIIHPYYASALAPGTGAMVGAGVVAFATLLRGPRRSLALSLLGIATLSTVGVQILLLHRDQYMTWLEPVLVIGGVCAYGVALLWRRTAPWAIAALLGLFAIAPGAYASTTWMAPVEGTFPAAGPKAAGGAGGVGVSGKTLTQYHYLIKFLRAAGSGSRWSLLTVSAPTAAPFYLLGLKAGSLAGYSGTDPAVDGPRLARFVAHREARFVLLGGEFSSRGGNAATAAVLRACKVVNPKLWHGPVISPYGYVLFDCAGRERELEGLAPTPPPPARGRTRARTARARALPPSAAQQPSRRQ